jgi:hypothetical protein
LGKGLPSVDVPLETATIEHPDEFSAEDRGPGIEITKTENVTASTKPA